MTTLDPSVSLSQLWTEQVSGAATADRFGSVTGAITTFDKPIPGSLGVLFDRDSATHMVSGLFSGDATAHDSSLGQEVLGELATIIAGGLADRLAELVEQSLSRSGVEYVTHPRMSLVRSMIQDDAPSQLTPIAAEYLIQTATGTSRCMVYAFFDLSQATKLN